MRAMRSPNAATLLSHHLSRSAEVSRKVSKLGEPITHRQNGLSVVDVDAWTELQRRQSGGKHIYQSQRRVVGHQMASAFRAVRPLARWRLHEHADMLGTGCDLHGIRLPKREGVDRPSRPR